MNLEFMKEIEALADSPENLRYILNDIIMKGEGVLAMCKEMGVAHYAMQDFLLQRRSARRNTRMKMAKYCLEHRKE